jgi:hypothetical protein
MMKMTNQATLMTLFTNRHSEELFVCLNHVASVIVNANHSIM